MLNCMIKDGLGVVNVEGTIAEIMGDITVVVKNIYDDLNNKKDSKEGARIFKLFVEQLLPELPFMSEDELEKAVDEQAKEAKKKKKELSGLKEMLQNILDELSDGEGNE